MRTVCVPSRLKKTIQNCVSSPANRRRLMRSVCPSQQIKEDYSELGVLPSRLKKTIQNCVSRPPPTPTDRRKTIENCVSSPAETKKDYSELCVLPSRNEDRAGGTQQDDSCPRHISRAPSRTCSISCLTLDRHLCSGGVGVWSGVETRAPGLEAGRV